MSYVIPFTHWTIHGECVIVKCPLCGYQAMLDHEIGKSGIVYPSIACPRNECRFHEWVRLAGWKDDEDQR